MPDKPTEPLPDAEILRYFAYFTQEARGCSQRCDREFMEGVAAICKELVEKRRYAAELEYQLEVMTAYTNLIQPSHDKHLAELQALSQIRFIAKGRDGNDPTPKGVTTDWRRILAICSGFFVAEGTDNATEG